jgi:hypothetical protein
VASLNTVHFELPHVVGQVVNLRADCQSAMRRYTTAAQDSILPHIETTEAKVNGTGAGPHFSPACASITRQAVGTGRGVNTLVCRIDTRVDAVLVRNAGKD